MKITILSLGRIREKYIIMGIEEFVKRLGAYCKLRLEEVEDLSLKDRMSEAERLQVLEREGDKLLGRIKEKEFVIALAIEGKMHSSEELANRMEECFTYQGSSIVFVIGGSLGLSVKVKERANLLLSFSRMTFPHPLMKLILIEQIYRAFKIMKGESYHK